MINGMHHVAIYTGDLDRSLSFYCDVLGLDARAILGWEAGNEVADRLLGLKKSSARHVMLRCGNTYLSLMEFSTQSTPEQDPGEMGARTGIGHICFDVTDLDAEFCRLRGAGVAFRSTPQRVGNDVWTVFGTDQDGNLLQLQELRRRDHPLGSGSVAYR